MTALRYDAHEIELGKTQFGELGCVLCGNARCVLCEAGPHSDCKPTCAFAFLEDGDEREPGDCDPPDNRGEHDPTL